MTTDTPTTAKVFFSWQSDTASRENRSLIEWALNRAIKILKADVDVSEADRSLAIDRDTIDTPGMPPVADTIFKKIDEAAIFVSDLTYVAFRARGEGIPNPNVLLEHGWALKSKGWPQVVGLMNTAYGHPKTHPLPFDLLHSRWPILYNCPAGADDAVRNAAREELAAVLVKALKLSIADDGFGASALGPHPHDVALLDRLRKLIPDRIHNFLVTHSFGTPFPRALLDPLFALRFEWIGARHEFHDRKLQAALETVREANEAFYSLVDTHVSATENRSDWCTAKPQEIPNETSRQAMYAAIKALDGTAYRLLEPMHPTIIELREWSRMTEDLSAERNRLANRFRHQLWRYFPQVIDLAEDWASLWILDLWDLIPTPARARTVRPETVAKLLKRTKVRRWTADTLLEQLRSTPLIVAPGVADACVAHCRVILQRLRLVIDQLRTALKHLDRLSAAVAAIPSTDPTPPRHHDPEILQSIPGVGPIAGHDVLQDAAVRMMEENVIGHDCFDPEFYRQLGQLMQPHLIARPAAQRQGAIGVNAEDAGQGGETFAASRIGAIGHEHGDQALGMVGQIGPVQMTGALAGPGLANGEQSTQPAVGGPIGWIDQNGSFIDELHATADNQTNAGSLRSFMGSDNAGDAVQVGNGKRLETARGGLNKKLITPARSTQKGELGSALELSVCRIHVPYLF